MIEKHTMISGFAGIQKKSQYRDANIQRKSAAVLEVQTENLPFGKILQEHTRSIIVGKSEKRSPVSEQANTSTYQKAAANTRKTSRYPRIWLENIEQTHLRKSGFIAPKSLCSANTESYHSRTG
jgi:hypothetical protein